MKKVNIFVVIKFHIVNNSRVLLNFYFSFIVFIAQAWKEENDAFEWNLLFFWNNIFFVKNLQLVFIKANRSFFWISSFIHRVNIHTHKHRQENIARYINKNKSSTTWSKTKVSVLTVSNQIENMKTKRESKQWIEHQWVRCFGDFP
jgi:hypothetical protein